MRAVALSVICAMTAARSASAQFPVALDASVGVKSGAQRVAISAWHHHFSMAGRVHLGLGLRASAYAGDPIGYVNRGTVQGNLAASVAIDPGVFGVNVAVFGEVDVVGPLSLGANLDVLGLAAGPARTIGSLEAKVQTVSYFLYGANDHGSLNSEFFAAVRVAPRVTVRAGLSHYETSYVVTDHGSSGSPSSRYQKFLSVPFVAVRLRL